MPGAGGPAVQPHLNSTPELANSGWRDYGNRSGLRRLVRLFREVGVPATAVVNSEAAAQPEIAAALRESGWELGAHGVNNSTGNAALSREEEAAAIAKCVGSLTASLGHMPTTWLTPQGGDSIDSVGPVFGRYWGLFPCQNSGHHFIGNFYPLRSLLQVYGSLCHVLCII